jgi:hypothetical protein
MNSNRTNSKLLNSLLPLNAATPNAPASASWSNWFGKSTTAAKNTMMGAANNAGNSISSATGASVVSVIVFVVVVLVFLGIMMVYKKELLDAWNNAKEVVTGYFGPKTPPPSAGADADAGAGADADSADGKAPGSDGSQPNAQAVMEKILPGGKPEVFNVSSNKYTYYDAEPLCKALGAELATYEQVKEAWSKGADWCNYGWVKGQLAVYPTSDETYQKLQSGPEEQRMACGRPGMNGGYFDNPEMRFGVTCVGKKPPQSKSDVLAAAAGAPLSPDALAYDKKVSQFKAEADNMALLPFNSKGWNS